MCGPCTIWPKATVTRGRSICCTSSNPAFQRLWNSPTCSYGLFLPKYTASIVRCVRATLQRATFNRSASLSLKEARPSSMSRSDVQPSSLVKVVSLVRCGPCSFGRGCTWIYLTHFFIVFVFQASNRSFCMLYDMFSVLLVY